MSELDKAIHVGLEKLMLRDTPGHLRVCAHGIEEMVGSMVAAINDGRTNTIHKWVAEGHIREFSTVAEHLYAVSSRLDQLVKTSEHRKTIDPVCPVVPQPPQESVIQHDDPVEYTAAESRKRVLTTLVTAVLLFPFGILAWWGAWYATRPWVALYNEYKKE